jgi:hypothetical protein
VTFDQYIKSMGLHADQLYTYKEIAQLLSKEPSTIRYWCSFGIRTRRHGIVSLERFNRGHETVVPGSSLIEFLRKTQRSH